MLNYKTRPVTVKQLQEKLDQCDEDDIVTVTIYETTKNGVERHTGYATMVNRDMTYNLHTKGKLENGETICNINSHEVD